MLYDSRFVVDKKPFDVVLAHDYSPPSRSFFTLGEMIGIQSLFDTSHGVERLVRSAVYNLHKKIKYDDVHTFHGIRSPSDVWSEKKGQCIEQDYFLKAVLDCCDVNTSWRVMKNFWSGAKSIHEVCVHPSLSFYSGNRRLSADLVFGEVWNGVIPSDCVVLNNRPFSFGEFASFYLCDAGEDFCQHDLFDESLRSLDVAHRINPNDYSVLCSRGWTFSAMGDLKRAKSSFESALSIAPDCLDVYKEFGDFLLRWYDGSPKYCGSIYREALNHSTRDLQVLLSLASRAGDMKMRDVECGAVAMALDTFSHRTIQKMSDIVRINNEKKVVVSSRDSDMSVHVGVSEPVVAVSMVSPYEGISYSFSSSEG